MQVGQSGEHGDSERIEINKTEGQVLEKKGGREKEEVINYDQSKTSICYYNPNKDWCKECVMQYYFYQLHVIGESFP